MEQELRQIKPIIRSILLALGGQATEQEFRKEYYSSEEESFTQFLNKFRMNFYQFMCSIPDVCQTFWTGDTVSIRRVSGQESAHMDRLTVVKKRKRATTFRPTLGSSYRSTSCSNTYRPPMRTSYGSHPAYGLSAKPQAPANNLYKRNEPAVTKPRYRPAAPRVALPPHESRRNMPTKIYKAPNLALSDDPKDVKPEESNDNILANLASRKLPSSLNDSSNDNSSWSSDENEFCESRGQANQREPEQKKFMMMGKENHPLEHRSAPQPKPSIVIPQAQVITQQPLVERQPSAMPRQQPAEKLSAANAKSQIIIKKPLVERQPTVVPRQQPAEKLSTANAKSQIIIKKPLVESQPTAVPRQRSAQELSTDFTSYVSRKEFVAEPYSIPCAKLKQLRLSREVLTCVKITECASPSQFILQFNQDDLKSMMEEMAIFYNAFKNYENLFVRKIVPGLPVAAVDEEGVWHRAEILLLNGSDVLVLFVDNGTRSYTKVKNIRFLEKSFAVQSRKSCKGTLGGVKPADSEKLWTPNARSEFFAKTNGRKLNATIHGIKDGVYEMTLFIDDEGKPRSKLADHLISAGFAEAVPIEGPRNIVLVSPMITEQPSCSFISCNISLKT